MNISFITLNVSGSASAETAAERLNEMLSAYGPR